MNYSDYWEKCWEEENPEELYNYLEGWNGYKGTEIDIFRQHNVRTVCDAACGFGAHSLAFASNGFTVSGFDISKRAVKLSTKGLRKFGYDDVELKTASITETGYPDGSFDAVTAYAVIDHLTLEDAKRAVLELMRILKPEGLLLLSFDKPEEEDFLCDHEVLEDGSMVYKDNTSREGMLFRPYDSDKIKALLGAYPIIEQWTSKRGSRFVIVQK